MKNEPPKWIKFNDTLVCSKCGFGYFPHNYYFKNHVCISASQDKFVFKYCPVCGQRMEE